MQETMGALGQLEKEDIVESREAPQSRRSLDGAEAPGAQIVASPTAVAEPIKEPADPKNVATIDGYTFEAMRWASKLPSDCDVLSLIRALPEAVVNEQVCLYRNRAVSAVAEKAKKEEPIRLGPNSLHSVKMLVAERFHKCCRSNGIVASKRMPYGFMGTFIRNNIVWTGKKKLQAKQIHGWYKSWCDLLSNEMSAVADGPTTKLRSEKCLLKSRGRVKAYTRRRRAGGGARVKLFFLRKALYEWWSSIRYAIDWSKMAEERRSRGKSNLARFPRSVLRLKMQQLLAEHAQACLLSGLPVETVNLDSWWFSRWEEDHGLSMRCANRKYEVPRKVQKERLEIFWVVLFRIRLFILLAFGYDPLIQNWDQSPFHHNETGAQNKPTLGVRGAKVPVVEGNSDVKSRWTAQLMTSSRAVTMALAVGESGVPVT